MIFIKQIRFFLITLFLSLIVLSFNASAHSPSSMDLIYDSTVNEVQVIISHQISNPDTHYVDNILIKINGITNVSQDYVNQPGSSFSYKYDELYLSEGDLIQVTANCNQGGSISKELTIGSEGVSESDNESSTPGFEIISLIVSIITIMYFVKKR